jgi:DNA-binding IclR family transcriptional regulator
MAGNSRTPGRSVINKVSAILRTIAEDRQSTLTEIAVRSDLPLSTTHRLVGELAAWGVLERTEDGCFQAGPPLRTISGACPGASEDALAGLRERAAPVMEDLFRATGAWVRVGYLDGMGVAYLEKTAAHLPVSDVCPARLPAHATALGKALLAFTPPRSVAPILDGKLRQYTPRTVTRPERLRLDLRTVRATRLAVCDGELEPCWSAVAMPVFDPSGNLFAAVELRVRHLDRDVPALRSSLAVAAGALSRELTPQEFRSQHQPFALVSAWSERRRRPRAPVVPITDAAGRRAENARQSGALPSALPGPSAH